MSDAIGLTHTNQDTNSLSLKVDKTIPAITNVSKMYGGLPSSLGETEAIYTLSCGNAAGYIINIPQITGTFTITSGRGTIGTFNLGIVYRMGNYNITGILSQISHSTFEVTATSPYNFTFPSCSIIIPATVSEVKFCTYASSYSQSAIATPTVTISTNDVFTLFSIL